ncbi:hypothetical protein [Kineococcus sp. SYSU DK004]
MPHRGGTPPPGRRGDREVVVGMLKGLLKGAVVGKVLQRLLGRRQPPR